MIRYAIDPARAAADIRAIDKKWFDKASTRTAKFVKQKGFAEAASIWSAVKPVFMKAQHNKCVFCERQFESPETGKIEFDLEHFRPKSSVEAWPVSGRHAATYDFATGAAEAAGYYWLAYDVWNYAASCKVCNTIYKLNYFPVAAARGPAASDFAALKKEKPFLCYPIGDQDVDPEALVGFVATTAVPVGKSAVRKRRGQVIIDFFGLNLRDQLHRERARMIALFGPSLRAISKGTGDATDVLFVKKLDLPDLPHAACLRAFKALWKRDAKMAGRILDLCRAYVVADAAAPPPAI